MRFPKSFEKPCGNRRFLKDCKICILQWNGGQKKNFAVEDIGAGVHQENYFTISGVGDDAQARAVQLAYDLANKRYGKTYEEV